MILASLWPPKAPPGSPKPKQDRTESRIIILDVHDDQANCDYLLLNMLRKIFTIAWAGPDKSTNIY